MIPSGYPYDTHWVSTKRSRMFFLPWYTTSAKLVPIGYHDLTHIREYVYGILDLYAVSLIP